MKMPVTLPDYFGLQKEKFSLTVLRTWVKSSYQQGKTNLLRDLRQREK